MSEKIRLKELLTKRSSHKGQVTKFKNYLANISNESTLNQIQLTELSLRLTKFEALAISFDDLQNEIEILSPDSIDTEIDERDNMEQDIILNIATAKTLLANCSNNRDINQTHNSMNETSCCSDHQDGGLRLPQIQIAKFDGAYFRWLEFRDTFENLIHNNSRISSIHKFHYLASYLEGDAARVISNLGVSSANYHEAWQLLCDRYNNKRVLINHHLNSLLNIKPLPRESERSLRFLIDHIKKNLRALASLGQPTDKWDVLIIFIMSSRLDSFTLSKWEECRNSLQCDVPSLDQFYDFLKNRADVLESVGRNKNDSNAPKPQTSTSRQYVAPNNSKSGQFQQTKSFASTNSRRVKSSYFSCIICNGNHKIYDCQEFKSKEMSERLSDVTKYKLCLNCLRQGHPTSECRMGPCRECKGKHNTLLHRQSPSTSNHVAVDEQTETIVNFGNEMSNQILLCTALIEVANPLTGQNVRVRALLDCGSQSSYISNYLKSKLCLNTNSIDCLKVIGIGNSACHTVKESCTLQIQSLNSNFNVTLSCLILEELTGNLPKAPVNISSIKLPTNVKLADPDFYKPGPIHILIGADLFWDILGTEQLTLSDNYAQLRSSKLGWLISGPMGPLKGPTKSTSCNQAIISENLENILKKFWELEEVPKTEILSEKERRCERHFLLHTRRDESGRFSVKLPLSESPDCLGDSQKLARKRFYYLEKRFTKNQSLRTEYAKFINEYRNLGHLSIFKETISLDNTYFLCHHAVLKQESESTKLRVVFDGSAPTTSGYSLNDILMVGPNVQDSLFSILIRARQYKYLLTADIEKMYRQVLVDEEDRKLQLILWREDQSRPIQIYKLNTLTYGTTSASYLSTRCLWQLGEEQNDDLVKNVIQSDFYVDDLITGSNSEEELIYIQNSVAKALQNGCFNLRKYKCNNLTIFKNIDLNIQDHLTLSESSSTLGLGWKPESDSLFFPMKNLACENDKITKRLIMSSSFKIFDPLGVLSPAVIQPKILLQKLWLQGYDWDQAVNDNIRDDWIKIVDSMHYLSSLQIPRLVLCNLPTSIELHSFSDASQCAFGACIYLRSINCDKEVMVRLLCAKSKVAPLKPTTIPRLELCAALLAARLCKSVLLSLRYKPDRLVHWCDSAVVLGWINSDLNKLKSFVANRTNEILELTKASNWRYVPTDSNPADLISRGINAKSLVSRAQWWSGPSFLQQNECNWPNLNTKVSQLDALPETKSFTTILATSEPVIKFENYSSFNKLVRTVAYVKRFIFNLKNINNKKIGNLSAMELKESFHSLCVFSQRESFSVEYDTITKGKTLNNKSKVLALSPFLDEDKLIRVGGRLNASIYTYEKKHPILLHAKHTLTKLYFEHMHKINMHAGPQLLLASVREQIWPVNGRHLARRTVNNCVRCRRLRGKTLCPKMGDLPAQRVNPDYPFISVGLDFAGPFMIINKKGRGSRLIKCYMCLFVCLRFKCIHLEAVSDLTKEAFIMTLRRFISRRGKPAEIFCDNGRNFVAASKDIGTFIQNNQEPLSDFAGQEGIKFMFIPTYAPHFGGIWEAGVKSSKYHIKRVIGNSHLTFEELLTLFAQVEAILNSRPLCPLSSSPNDFLSLSPGHFLIGRPLTALPTRPLENCSATAIKRYERLEEIRHHFWQRWQKEYVAELQQRTKWKTNMATINVGDMVVLQEDATPPLQWRLGRIARLFPGPDGVSRVADVSTARGCVRRPLTRICPLPTAEDLKG